MTGARACAWCDEPAVTTVPPTTDPTTRWPACQRHADEHAQHAAAVRSSAAQLAALDAEADADHDRRVHRAAVEVLRDHRRQTAARRCTGCAWQPTVRGRNDDPAVKRARHAEFNDHLAGLIAAASR